ncbi:hypothetical protein JCM8547_000609 [Rhodosporidiobolus lusitaniae]
MHTLPRSYTPHRPSNLSSSSSSPASSPHPHAPSSDLPSSPTTSSFYRTPQPPRTHKSRHSSRPSSSSFFPSSSSLSLSLNTSARLAALSSAHVARSRAARASLSASRRDEEGTVGADEPGGWTAQGEWEEFDDEERARLEVEMMKARREWRWECKRREEEAEEEMGVLEEEENEEESGEEPPLDILYEDLDPSLSLPSPSLFPPRLPSLPSAAGSESLSEPPEDSDMDGGGGEYGESQESQDSSAGGSREEWGEEEKQERLREFDEALVGAQCPACGKGRVGPNGQGGAACRVGEPAGGMGKSRQEAAEGGQGCGWRIDSSVTGPLREAFAAHYPPPSRYASPSAPHLPLLHHTPFTGTLVLCSQPGCEEQFAV